MAKKTGVKTYKQTVVNAIVIAVVLFLFLYLGVQFSRSFSDKVSTQRTQTVTDTDYAYLEGYVFKDETVISSPSSVVRYLVRDGAKVGVEQDYAKVYAGVGLSASALAEKQAQINSLSNRIFLIESGLSSGLGVEDLGTVNGEISSSYYTYIDNVIDGDYRTADKSGAALLSSLVDYAAITKSEVTSDAGAQLNKELSAALSSLGVSPKTLTSDRSFTFFYETDGYEKIFSSSKLDTLTPKGLDALISAKPDGTQGHIGKMALSNRWYLAIPANEATYLQFVAGDTYEITFSDNNDLTLRMKLERICIDEADVNSAFMLFSSFDLSPAADFARMQNVRIKLDSRTGYKIPKESLREVNGEEGVYILVGNIVEFRRVTLIGRGNGYYIVNTYEADLAEDISHDVPYLNVNDLIITSGNDLYDGKHLD